MSYKSFQGILTVQEVAEILKLSALTIYKYIKEGQLEAMDLGGHYRIEEVSLRRFMENHRIKKEGDGNE